MDRLLAELTARGVLDASTEDWAREHHAEHGGSLDTALLELDLIDEQDLLAGLKQRFGRAVATPADFASVEPDLGQRLPASFGKSFRMCPVRLSGSQLVALVPTPLPAEWVEELRELFGLELRELVAPEHYLALASEKAYGTLLDARTRALEARLARRRGAPKVVDVVGAMARAPTIAACAAALLELGTCLVENCLILVMRNDELRVVSAGGGSASRVPIPETGCSLHPAIVHGGYFFGPVAEADANRSFFDGLGRALPRRAFVAPMPSPRSGRAVLYADNGPRGIATRWIAELTVLAARFGHKAGEWDAPAAAAPASALTPDEERVLARLKSAASEAGVDLVAFVDELLAARATRPDQPAEALVGEVKGLFERLATDIPTHLARGMEAAFRDLVPRLGGAPVAAASQRLPAAEIEIVRAPAAPREVASYTSRRQKARRIKL